MLIRNYLDTPAIEKPIHEGEGLVLSRKLFGAEDFATRLRYVAHTELPPGASFGFHQHQDEREEIYVILSGSGRVRINEEERAVSEGDVILTCIGDCHSLMNDGEVAMKVFVFWVAA